MGWLLIVLPRVRPLLRPLHLINEKCNSFFNCLILYNCYNYLEFHWDYFLALSIASQMVVAGIPMSLLPMDQLDLTIKEFITH